MNRIKEDDLKDGNVYAITARNANVGIWDVEKRGFLIPRNKFGEDYLFIEYEYDTDPTFGTAKAYFDLGEAPDLNDKNLLKWLIEKNVEARNMIKAAKEEVEQQRKEEKANELGVTAEELEKQEYWDELELTRQKTIERMRENLNTIEMEERVFNLAKKHLENYEDPDWTRRQFEKKYPPGN